MYEQSLEILARLAWASDECSNEIDRTVTSEL